MDFELRRAFMLQASGIFLRILATKDKFKLLAGVKSSHLRH